MKRASTLLLAITTALAAPRAHALLLGGGSLETDCFAAFDGPAVDRTFVVCGDGDPGCDADATRDGACVFSVRICAHVDRVHGCHSRRIADIRVRKRGGTLGTPDPPIPLPALLTTRQACGDLGRVTVPLRGRGRKRGKVKLRMIAIENRTNPNRVRRDRDTVTLVCLPVACPRNGLGPAELTVQAEAAGSDVDLGSSGALHDMPGPARWGLTLCLTGCDEATNPVCQASGGLAFNPVRLRTFGQPVPLVAAGMPVCVVNRLADPTVSGTANVQTGAIDLTARVLASVYVTDPNQLCPRCSPNPEVGLACDGGLFAGAPCTPEAVVTVKEAPGDNVYMVSSSCPPAGTAMESLLFPLPLTTGTSTRRGPAPCAEPVGPAAPDDGCGDGTCTDGICTDCLATTAEGACVASRGGIRQACCSNDPSLPCFPTAPGTAGKIERVGTPVAPLPAWPDPTYPKLASGARMVATFCAQPVSPLDGVTPTGAPNEPGAVIVPLSERWLR